MRIGVMMVVMCMIVTVIMIMAMFVVMSVIMVVVMHSVQRSRRGVAMDGRPFQTVDATEFLVPA